MPAGAQASRQGQLNQVVACFAMKLGRSDKDEVESAEFCLGTSLAKSIDLHENE